MEQKPNAKRDTRPWNPNSQINTQERCPLGFWAGERNDIREVMAFCRHEKSQPGLQRRNTMITSENSEKPTIPL